MKLTIGMYLSIYQEPINLTDKTTLNYLCNFLKRKYFEIEEIAKILGVSRKTIGESLSRLEKMGYIHRKKQKKYYLTSLSSRTLAILKKYDESNINVDLKQYLDDGESISDLFNKVMRKETKNELFDNDFNY